MAATKAFKRQSKYVYDSKVEHMFICVHRKAVLQ